MTREEKENEERRIISAFIEKFADQKLDIQDESQIAYIKKAITDVFRLEIEELGYKIKGEEQEGEEPFELEFYNDPNSTIDGIHYSYLNKIKYNISRLSNYLVADDKKSRMDGVTNFFVVVFHEIQHERQYMLSQIDLPSKESVLHTKECILSDLSKEFYDNNYGAFAMENNANATGYSQYINLMENDNYYDSDYMEKMDLKI